MYFYIVNCHSRLPMSAGDCFIAQEECHCILYDRKASTPYCFFIGRQLALFARSQYTICRALLEIAKRLYVTLALYNVIFGFDISDRTQKACVLNKDVVSNLQFQYVSVTDENSAWKLWWCQLKILIIIDIQMKVSCGLEL